MTGFDMQPTLENDLLKIQPLTADDFETLYNVAADPLIWEQHPNKDRYKRPVFETFFKGAMESGAAFLVLDKKTGEPIGSSRFYDFNLAEKSIAIGYTFLSKSHWGGTFNKALKTLMLDHAFTRFDKVILHIGANNIRSQRATEKLGATKIGEIEMEYYGEASRLNFVYGIDKENWNNRF
jgi:RimJ/RimL family protein N-acetyltransferase